MKQPNLLTSGIRDNHNRGSVADFLRSNLYSGSLLSIVSAYFTIYAFEKLEQELSEIKELNFLFGEPTFIKSVNDTAQLQSFKIEDDQIKLETKLQQNSIAKRCEQWIKEKVNIRSIIQSNLLHGKLYHIINGNKESAILGSSNFTVKGLGLAENNSNIELNLVVDSDRDRQDLKFWFDEVWNNPELVKDVKQEVINYLQQLYQDNPPSFIYYKTLYHLFFRDLLNQEKGDRLLQQQHLLDTKIWSMLFDFQKDGVKGVINKILTYNGCILADSVGLGKTFEALAVIKYFELLNYRILVLCPKKLRENWTIYQAQNNSELNILLEDRFNYTVLSHTDLSRDNGKVGDIDLATINWGNYDLIVIDESHNFRNNTKGKKDEDGNIIKKSRYERLLDDVIKSGIKSKVLLLSATPVNNNLKDLKNQLDLISEGKESAFSETLGISNIKQVLTNAQTKFKQWATKDNRSNNELLESLSSAFFTLLDGLTIARSRKHIEQYYPEVVDNLGGFPERLKPLSVFYRIDLDDNFLDYEDIYNEISKYKLSLFTPSSYVLEDYKSLYEGKVIQRNFTQENREYYLIGMMRVNFLKRLESSIYSFKLTLERTIAKIEELIKIIKEFKQYKQDIIYTQDEEIRNIINDDDEFADAFQVGQKINYHLVHLDIEKWLNELIKDKKQLNKLYLQAQAIDNNRDAKLAELKELIKEKVNNPTINKLGKPNRKIIVFTAFADTATYLYDSLKTWAKNELNINLALVTGSNKNKTTLGETKFEHILTNFAPYAKKRDKIPSLPQHEEIDLLIATDCISEGQNLQDCDYLINYDIHWNPVRIIQRFGRIDRIGSPNSAVQLVNFWITQDFDQYINLRDRVESRMALMDLTATGEDNLLDEELIKKDLNYRDNQLLRLQEEVLDLEDFNDSISLNEFSLEDFRTDLLNYIQENRKALEEAPLGLYAVVPPLPEHSVIKPGVIFCLQQKGDTKDNQEVNPL
ncbi:helicase-related protein [Cyanobacterium sp. DS4]|uniref:helicase-related protein n=1 Tax=Cyanobacterium sp. DS4 TaxID=2878255 RepID=UPI002E8110AF|nr:helicase-related protein [Cyanobacterium sp. Dongsha4]WVL00420.1 phospholipase D-like domain-containing protein [Cyanobacterium sp. Dongsha4]